jgi:thioredoxin-dependent peroxiredoxin
MSERNDVVKMKGGPLTLDGNEIKVGDTAPDFTVLDDSLSPVKLSDFKGKTVIVVSVPSVDTPTCDLEAKRFNKEAGKFGDDTAVLTISMDLPFAQARWCAAAGVENNKLLSDYRDREFGNNYGVLIKELGLLARTIFVIDKAGKVQYIQYVVETTEEPNYDEVLQAVKKLQG